MCNKPGTKGQVLYDSTYMRDLLESAAERQKAEGGCQGLQRGRNGELFNGCRVSVLQDEKNSGDALW